LKIQFNSKSKIKINDLGASEIMRKKEGISKVFVVQYFPMINLSYDIPPRVGRYID
jgi:hypothetical protein